MRHMWYRSSEVAMTVLRFRASVLFVCYFRQNIKNITLATLGVCS